MDEAIHVLAVGRAPSVGSDGVTTEHVPDLEAALTRLDEGGIDVALVPYADDSSTIAAVRARAADVPVVAVAEEEDGLAALEAGAHDYVVATADPATLRRALRYATSLHRLQGELHRHQIVDELTHLYNARGFEQLAGHHLRLADRTQEPVVLVFVRLDDLASLSEALGASEGPRLIAETAEVLREVVRDADVLARVGTDAFCILLTGNALGAEALVLSRLVEAVATRNARSGRPVPLSLSVGAARYDPSAPIPLDELMAQADRQLRRGDTPA